MPSVLRIENVTKRYGEQAAVDAMSFHIEQGEIVGLVGPNGSGKTTLMRIIVGLIREYDGRVLIDEQDIRTQGKSNKKQVGCVIEQPGFYPFMSGYQNLQYIHELLGGGDQQELQSIVELLGLKDAVHKLVSKYSLGMRQRLGIAQALLHNPNLLVLDEPTNGLDPTGIHEMRKYLRETADSRKVGMLVSSHDLAEIERICDRVIIVQNGKMLRTVNLKETQEDSGMALYVIETSAPDKMAEFVKTLNLHVVSVAEKAIKVSIAKNNMQATIRAVFHAGLDVKGVYESRESLEDQFLGLMGGNRIG